MNARWRSAEGSVWCAVGTRVCELSTMPHCNEGDGDGPSLITPSSSDPRSPSTSVTSQGKKQGLRGAGEGRMPAAQTPRSVSAPEAAREPSASL